MQRCPVDLPDALAGDKETIQHNRKAHQRQYHGCRKGNDKLIDTLLEQGVKPVRGM